MLLPSVQAAVAAGARARARQLWFDHAALSPAPTADGGHLRRWLDAQGRVNAKLSCILRLVLLVAMYQRYRTRHGHPLMYRIVAKIVHQLPSVATLSIFVPYAKNHLCQAQPQPPLEHVPRDCFGLQQLEPAGLVIAWLAAIAKLSESACN
eukprot:COSAG01_NODE_39777_length_472_cov_0.900804_1_plen_150_part_10